MPENQQNFEIPKSAEQNAENINLTAKNELPAIPENKPNINTSALLNDNIQDQKADNDEKAEELKKIEKVLSEGMDNYYQGLDEEKKILFRERGEETAKKVQELLHEAKKHFMKIVQLILSWLKILPGVNRFFLEQQALIKAQKITKEAENKKI